MFYTFYIGTQAIFDEIKTVVKEITLNMHLKNNIDIVCESDNELEFDCTWFNLSIRNDVKNILFRSEDYCMNLKYQLWFEVYYTADGISENMMLKLIGAILEQIADSGILFSNGDKPILQKIEGKVIVDDSRLDSEERFPFRYLNIKFEEGKLEQI